MAVISTNSLSLMTQNNLNKSQASLGSAIERLSSGSRINSAKDDASGQAIANRFTSNINGLTTAARNANDGISMAQTAEGALSEINNNLQRVRDLTVKAQNSSNSASDIDSIQSEVNQRMEEIDRVTKQTDFNGIKILDNRAGDDKAYNFQVGAKDGEQINIDIKASSGWNLAAAGANGTSTAALNKNGADLTTATTTYNTAHDANLNTQVLDKIDTAWLHIKQKPASILRQLCLLEIILHWPLFMVQRQALLIKLLLQPRCNLKSLASIPKLQKLLAQPLLKPLQVL